MQFSLRFLLCFVAIEALGCVALIRPSPWIASAFVTFATVAILIAVLKSIVSEGSDRAFHIGFALTGSFYVMLSMSPLFGQTLNHHLLTTRVLVAFEPALLELPERSKDSARGSMRHESLAVLAYSNDENAETRQAYYQIGQSLWSIMTGCAGGFLLQVLRSNAMAKKKHRKKD